MARPKSPTPILKAHISGQSVCRIDGIDFYLGRHGTPESLAKYAVLIREYQANGLSLPEGFSPETLRHFTEGFSQPAVKMHMADSPIVIRHLTTAFVGHAERVYANSKAELSRIRQICEEIETQDGNTLVEDYGPKKLKEQRERWVRSGKCRRYCNRLTCLVVSIFEWGVSEEMIEESTWNRLTTVKPLREGQTEAPESVVRKPACLNVVRATVKELSPTLKAMVRIHVCTGMRPSELCSMRPCDIDRSGEVWLYRPATHKNKSKGHDRVIPILGDAREAIENYLNRPSQAYCFSASESVAWWQAKKRSERKSKVQPSQESRAVESPRVKPGEKYTQDSYRRAIARACKRAKVDSWYPYQLRHLNLTEVRDALSAEHAQAIGGHSRIDMTNTYAKAKIGKAIEAARHAPTLGGSDSKPELA